MIDLYTWSTPNGMKVNILLEEAGLAYRLKPVRLGAGEQMRPAFLALNPNGKVPVIVDSDGPAGAPFTLFESGAILLYLAEKAGAFLPGEAAGRMVAVQWVMFQMAGLGPMFGQVHHFASKAPEGNGYALARYASESERLLDVIDGRLSEAPFLAGLAYSIADMAAWPWVRSWQHTIGRGLGERAALRRWYDDIEGRPAVMRAVATYLALRQS